MRAKTRRWWSGLLVVVLLGWGSGCARSGERGEKRQLETVEVPPALDVATEDDPQARPRPVSLVGVLPTGFPADLPIYLPASVVDFGAAAGATRQVELLSPHALGEVASALEQRLRQKGWSVESTPTSRGRRLHLSKGNRQAWLEVRDARPGTTFAYEYRPEL